MRETHAFLFELVRKDVFHSKNKASLCVNGVDLSTRAGVDSGRRGRRRSVVVFPTTARSEHHQSVCRLRLAPLFRVRVKFASLTWGEFLA